MMKWNLEEVGVENNMKESEKLESYVWARRVHGGGSWGQQSQCSDRISPLLLVGGHIRKTLFFGSLK